MGNSNIYSQTISVDDSGFTPQQLVNLLLSTSCATNSNINISSSQSIAYFNVNGSTFHINEGIIIRSGLAANTSGIYTGTGLDSQVTTNGDPDLQAISNQTGQSATITDAAFLEFDFIPSSTNFSFNFLFASNEYGEWQCGFSDVFAFLLTDLTTGITTNLAVIPGTSTPISVRDIRDNQFNSSCNSVNPELFSTYNVDDPANSTLNMRGHTVVLNAASNVTPNNPYRIKLVIGDYNDSDFDSAVFIEAGSFDTFLDLGPDGEICSGDDFVVNSGYTNITDFTYQWFLDGNPIATATNPTYTVTQSGTYTLEITTIATGCVISDQIVFSDLQTLEPNDLLECDTGGTSSFNLTVNDEIALGIDDTIYDVFYYSSLDNASNNVPIVNTLLTNYPAVGGETIYMRIRNNDTDNLCDAILEFNLNVVAIEAGIPNDIEACDDDLEIDITFFVESDILNGLNADDYTVSYFLLNEDAQNDTNPIADPTVFSVLPDQNPLTVFARLTDNDNPVCFDIVQFDININSLPPVSDSADVYVCTQYTLPSIANGNYFTGSNGTGVPLNPGQVINSTTQIFIYNVSDEGCSAQRAFTIYMADEYDIPLEYCGEFEVPSYPNAEFYTAPDGPNGTGTIIPSGTIITTNQTIYFYAIDATDNSFCSEMQFDLIIHPIPPVDSFDDVITCNSYTLEPITNGNYFTEENGGGTQLNPGDEITGTQTIYVYNIDPITGCNDSSTFDITIIDTSVFQDLSECGGYTIPTTEFGGYFTEAAGAGNPIPAGTIITDSQTVYYYAPEITTLPNCTDSIEIDITIHPIPPVDSLDDVLRCEDDPYELPELVNGQYFTEPSGQGLQLSAGGVITSTQTIYIYNSNTFCDAETSFEVEIRPFPPVDNFTDIFSCEPYTLPVLANGNYFTGPGATGDQLNAGDVISTTQILYIFNEYPDLAGCVNENVFTINILGIEADAPEDVIACETYELPELTVGSYFTEPEGEGTQLNAGDIISTTQTIYVYAENGDRFLCTDENEFTVTIFERPTLPEFPNLEGCASVDLPVLNIPGVEISYYRRPNQEDLINPSDYTITELGSRIIYVYASPVGIDGCATETLFQVTVYPLLDLQIEGGTICIDSETGETTNPLLLESGLSPNEFTVEWFLNDELVGTGSDYSAIQAGTYRVETTKLIPDVGADCNYATTEVEVIASTPVFEINFLNGGDFAASSTVEIKIIDPGLGRYEFSLDGGPFQTFDLFYNVPAGSHTITVRDVNGICGDFILEFSALDFPKFFTPNDDGVNDTWNIGDLRNNSTAEIKIFNRLGRLVAQIKADGLGWNGYNQNGRKEPSSDYWFLVEYTQNGIINRYSGNFSLIRK